MDLFGYAAYPEAARELGLSVGTLRRWKAEGKLEEAPVSGHERFPGVLAGSSALVEAEPRTVVYFRMHEKDTPATLMKKRRRFEDFCHERGYHPDVVTAVDLEGSPDREVVAQLVTDIVTGGVERLVIGDKRVFPELMRRLLFDFCRIRGVEVVRIEHPDVEPTSPYPLEAA